MRFSTLAVAFTAPFLVTAAPTKIRRAAPNDVLVLQFAEVLERLETQFYQEALAKFGEQDFIDAGIPVPAIAVQNFQAILEHETAHTLFLDVALGAVGAEPVPDCTFSFDTVLTDVKTMASVARVVEAVGVGAYLGGSVLIEDPNILIAAASILTIEARHQSFLNILNGANAIPQAFDIPLTPSQVLALAGGFIQGCTALNIPANPALAITNQEPPAPGTTLTFSSPALDSAGDQQQLSCQMITGVNTTALSFPIGECIVPEGINGPVAIFITKDPQPLLAGKDNESILAGPTIAFIDAPDALGSLIRNGANTVPISDQLTPSQANDLLSSYSGAITTETGAATTDSSGAVATETSAAATDSVATESLGATDPVATESLAASESAATPTDTASSDASDATPAEANSAPTSAPEGPIVVIGHSTVPA
jgi:hypothetical protein